MKIVVNKAVAFFFLLAFLLVGLLAGCRPVSPTPVPTPTPTASPTPTSIPTSPTPTASPTPSGMGIYKNTTYGFSISYPGEWVEQETEEQGLIVVISGTAGLPIIRVFLEYLTEVIQSKEYALDAKSGMMASISKFQVLSEGETTLGKDTTAYEILFTGVSGDNTPIKVKMVFAVRGSQGFILQGLSTVSNFDRRQETIEQVLSSFRLEEPTPFGVPRKEALTLYDTGPITLDPALSREVGSHLYVLQVFSGLVELDKSMAVVPGLAEGWNISGDGTVYTFRLRRGARFHNGREVKAQDFKYSVERAANPDTGSQTARTYLGDIVGVKDVLEGRAKEVRGVKVLDDYTLEITIDAPKAYFLAKLAYPTSYIVDRENVASGAKWWEKPNGTGPFKLMEWKKDELLILKRNELYYKDPPKVGYVVFKLFGGVPMRMYETGEIDVTWVGLGDIERVMDKANPLNKELRIFPELSVSYIGFNNKKPPFSDPKIRKAFVHALDRDRLVEQVLRGTVTKAEGVLPPGMPGYDDSFKGIPFDVGKAKALIAESSYGDVSRLPPITLTTAGFGGQTSPLLSAIVDMWRQNLGVEVKLRLLDPDVYAYTIKQEKDELFDFGWVADYPDPENFLDVLFHTGSENNDGEYSNPELDSLLERARVEKDIPARLAMYQKAERMLIDNAGAIPLWHNINYILVKPYVEGYALDPLGIPLFKEISLKPH